jgi:hypothetical protein
LLSFLHSSVLLCKVQIIVTLTPTHRIVMGLHLIYGLQYSKFYVS